MPKSDLSIIVQQLFDGSHISREHLTLLIQNRDSVFDSDAESLSVRKVIQAEAVRRRHEVFGAAVYKRGLIECSSYCKNNCMYCGIRRGNCKAERYRLSPQQILECCKTGYGLGFRTFVLQGGEDSAFTPEVVAAIIHSIKAEYPDCAVTLSFGEQPAEVYRLWKEAGANRYLLRHESADDVHYAFLHAEETGVVPASDCPFSGKPARTAAYRKECLFTLKRLGYQTGSGFMVGSPGQSAENLADDILFLRELNPQMIGIGPFIPHPDTPFAAYQAGPAELTTFLISVLRIIFPRALIPSTTALGTIDVHGREQGLLAGANVVMPNLSPASVRKKYSLYKNKLSDGAEAAEYTAALAQRIAAIGYVLTDDRGDYPDM